MIFTTIILKTGTKTIKRLNYYSQIQTAFVMKWKHKTFLRSYGRIKIYLTTVIIQKTEKVF